MDFLLTSKSEISFIFPTLLRRRSWNPKFRPFLTSNEKTKERSYEHRPKRKPSELMRYLLQITMATDDVTDRASDPITPICDDPSDDIFSTPLGLLSLCLPDKYRLIRDMVSYYVTYVSLVVDRNDMGLVSPSSYQLDVVVELSCVPWITWHALICFELYDLDQCLVWLYF